MMIKTTAKHARQFVYYEKGQLKKKCLPTLTVPEGIVNINC